MTAGYVLQTVGINHTTATNAGFITVLYVVLAPAGATLIGRHSPDQVDLVCLGLALTGLGLLSIRDGRLHAGDLVVLAGAAAFAGHIVAVDVLVDRYAALPLAVAQMAASAALTAAIAVPAGPQAGEVASLWWIFILTGVLGSGIAFSVQVMAQQSLSPCGHRSCSQPRPWSPPSRQQFGSESGSPPGPGSAPPWFSPRSRSRSSPLGAPAAIRRG
jgi:drug/metabolite transporter (DMT)-like permease